MKTLLPLLVASCVISSGLPRASSPSDPPCVQEVENNDHEPQHLPRVNGICVDGWSGSDDPVDKFSYWMPCDGRIRVSVTSTRGVIIKLFDDSGAKWVASVAGEAPEIETWVSRGLYRVEVSSDTNTRQPYELYIDHFCQEARQLGSEQTAMLPPGGIHAWTTELPTMSSVNLAVDGVAGTDFVVKVLHENNPVPFEIFDDSTRLGPDPFVEAIMPAGKKTFVISDKSGIGGEYSLLLRAVSLPFEPSVGDFALPKFDYSSGPETFRLYAVPRDGVWSVEGTPTDLDGVSGLQLTAFDPFMREIVSVGGAGAGEVETFLPAGGFVGVSGYEGASGGFHLRANWEAFPEPLDAPPFGNHTVSTAVDGFTVVDGIQPVNGGWIIPELSYVDGTVPTDAKISVFEGNTGKLVSFGSPSVSYEFGWGAKARVSYTLVIDHESGQVAAPNLSLQTADAYGCIEPEGTRLVSHGRVGETALMFLSPDQTAPFPIYEAIGLVQLDPTTLLFGGALTLGPTGTAESSWVIPFDVHVDVQIAWWDFERPKVDLSEAVRFN